MKEGSQFSPVGRPWGSTALSLLAEVKKKLVEVEIHCNDILSVKKMHQLQNVPAWAQSPRENVTEMKGEMESHSIKMTYHTQFQE